MSYRPAESRYDTMNYQRCGRSGLRLPALSLGLWHNFGDVDDFPTARRMILTAFDNGITHFDLANNYGPPPGSAECNFGKILKEDLAGWRDELIISTKAGYRMWPGPYGDGGSRKYLLASLEQSLRRMGLDYADIFYSHRPDPSTPLEETCAALDQILRQGKALYVGLSNYPAEQTRKAFELLQTCGHHLLIHQPKYSMLVRDIETNGLLDTLADLGVGCIAFCPLAQGLLTSKYLQQIPPDSRAAKPHGFLKKEQITDALRKKLLTLNQLAAQRGQTLAQMALAWVLRDSRITSALIGASRPEQILENLKALDAPSFTQDELARIDSILKDS
ncbi:MAG TPA: L-glyceraldehyde 3-phosphate reductase [Anaerohalosphaeraceae bacterium]|nr:L-glyceraldehyde 3-phosphate reductase [Anaerohalosphaeraceae bacterium]HPB92282.1 L-glyceraldehyde 3-phosphate reductase [Anaerohalosphaeraceae bacterium]HRT24427.1 L-glyceraldehyde 3-phosphate reductase [Anaerohalosphaeraceae bacterium]